MELGKLFSRDGGLFALRLFGEVCEVWLLCGPSEGEQGSEQAGDGGSFYTKTWSGPGWGVSTDPASAGDGFYLKPAPASSRVARGAGTAGI